MHGSRGAHQRARAVERVAIDRDEDDVALGRGEEVAVGIGVARGGDEHIAVQPFPQAAETIAPAEGIGRIGRRHPAELLVAEGAIERVAVVEVGHLERAEEVLRAPRRLVGSQADAQAGLARVGHPRGLAIEPEVREGRPDDRSAMCFPLLVLLGSERGGVHGDQARVQAAVVTQGLELRDEVLVASLREVVDEGEALVQWPCGSARSRAASRARAPTDGRSSFSS